MTKVAKQSKLKNVRETEGWPVSRLAAAAGIAPATVRKAESGGVIRDHMWGKILKAINGQEDKSKTYEMADVKD